MVVVKAGRDQVVKRDGGFANQVVHEVFGPSKSSGWRSGLQKRDLGDLHS